MSFLNKIKNALVETTEKPEEPKLDPSKPIKQQISSKPVHTTFEQPSTPSTYSPAPSTTSTLNDLIEFRKHFETILADENKNNMPGIDYFEFIQAKNNMPLPVESQKYTVAFSAQAPGGLTKNILLQTGQHYIQVIDSELNEFTVGFESTYKEQVENKKAVIEQKSQLMLQLSQQIDGLNKEIATLRDEMTGDESNLVGKKNAFVQAATEAKNMIAQELEKINQYIV
jgi:hypothetical protein